MKKFKLFLLLCFLSISLNLFAIENELKINKWVIGSMIDTPSGLSLEVLNKIEDGHKGIVYKVRNKEGNLFALKVPISRDERIMESFIKEPQKSPYLDALKANYAKIVEHGKNYILKQWVEGTRGDQWLKSWVDKGANKNDEGFIKLIETFITLSDKGAYIGNLKPLNMILEGKDWVIVDPGSIELETEDALEKFHQLLLSRWKMSTDHADVLYSTKTVEEHQEIPLTDSTEPNSQPEIVNADTSSLLKSTKKKLRISQITPEKWILTPGGLPLKIKKYIDSGKRGMVWKARDRQGKEYAIKIAKNNDKETLESIQREPEKESSVKPYGVEVAHIVEHGNNYLVKEWVNGIRGDEWLRKWVDKGKNVKDPVFVKLISLFDDLAAKGVFVGDLNRKNLIYDGKKWVIVESGRAHPSQDPVQLKKDYRRMLGTTWNKYIKCRDLLKIISRY